MRELPFGAPVGRWKRFKREIGKLTLAQIVLQMLVFGFGTPCAIILGGLAFLGLWDWLTGNMPPT